jgi:hypothetical protein
MTKTSHSEYVIGLFIALPRQWLRERVSILRYTYIACLFETCCNTCEAMGSVQNSGQDFVVQFNGKGSDTAAQTAVRNAKGTRSE